MQALNFDQALALIHIGILLAEYDSTLTDLPSSLYEVEERLIHTFHVNARQEPTIAIVRDKISAIIELYENNGGTIQ